MKNTPLSPIWKSGEDVVFQDGDTSVCGFCEDARWKDDFCSYFKKRED